MTIFLLALFLGLLGILQASFWFAVLAVRTVVRVTLQVTLARVTIIAVGIVLFAVPLLVVIKVFTGWVWAIYAAAMIAAFFTIVLALVWTPLALLIGAALHPIQTILHPVRRTLLTGQTYVRSVAVILFAELMFAMGLLLVPFHQNIGAIPFFLLAGASVVLAGLLWGGYLGPRFYRGVAATAFIFVTLSFFLPKTFEATSKKMGGIDEGIACGMDATRAGCAEIVAKPATAKPVEVIWHDAGTITAPVDKCSAEYATPSMAFKLVPERGRKARAFYSDGQYDLLDSHRQVDLRPGERSGSGPRFCVQAVGDKPATVFLYTAKR